MHHMEQPVIRVVKSSNMSVFGLSQAVGAAEEIAASQANKIGLQDSICEAGFCVGDRKPHRVCIDKSRNATQGASCGSFLLWPAVTERRWSEGQPRQ